MIMGTSVKTLQCFGGPLDGQLVRAELCPRSGQVQLGMRAKPYVQALGTREIECGKAYEFREVKFVDVPKGDIVRRYVVRNGALVYVR